MDYLARLQQYKDQGVFTEDVAELMRLFFEGYLQAIAPQEPPTDVLNNFIDLTARQISHPFKFSNYHQRVRTPFDYYAFGLNFMRPVIDLPKCIVLGWSNVEQMVQQLAAGDNIVLFSNHQVEPDPQVLSILLETKYPKLAEEIIFVAGHRVTTDPMAVPFSMGCNLLCIVSKKYIEDPPEEKEAKLQYNRRTMQQMQNLLSEGGKCIFVAPSGGRDRPDATGRVEVAPFDPQSIEMFYLTARKAGRPTHFYPLALVTYDLLPPPNSIQKQLGEPRTFTCTPVHAAFGDELDMEALQRNGGLDKKEQRKVRAEAIWNKVRSMYDKLVK